MSIFSPISKNLLNQIKMEEINSLDWEKEATQDVVKEAKNR